jgi:ubiquinone/menaquinone biosynthesis C-methylase UbiE
MGLYKNFVSQTRKPEGVLGKMMVNGMNGGHAAMADWGMSHLQVEYPTYLLEIGCGGGRNAGELMKKYPSAYMTAVDYSDVSVEKATAYNKDAIENGRCEVKQGDASNLDLPDGKFELATAFETIYFWPGLHKCFSEVFRVLKDEGTFMIVNESDGKDEASLKYESIIEGMKCYTIDDIESAIISAGFKEVKSFHHDSKPWITVIAKK